MKRAAGERGMKTWANRIVGHAELAPQSLTAHDKNWRQHPDYQRTGMKKVLGTVGWVRPVLVNQRTQTIIDGHLRVVLALEHHEPTVPVEYVDLSHEEELEVLASLDSLGALAIPDPEILRSLAQEVPLASFWPQGELSKILGHLSGEEMSFPEEEAPDMEGATPTRAPSEEARIPLSIVLTTLQNRRWQAYKESQGVSSDLAGFLTLLEGVDSP
jgi:hypothetical protein